MRNLWLFVIIFSSIQIRADEFSQFRRLREMGKERARMVTERMTKLLEEQPELRKYISRPPKRYFPPKKGKRIFNILAIRVEFQEDTSSLTTGNGRMDMDGNPFPYDSLGYPTHPDSLHPFDSLGHDIYYDPSHTKRYFELQMEALRNYYLDNSGGKLDIQYRVVPDEDTLVYQLPYSMLYYGDEENYVQGLLTLVRDAITICDRESPEIDFSEYRGDNGTIVIFHAGSMWQSDYFWDSPYDLLACYVSSIDEYFGTPIWVDNGTVPITDAVLYPETGFQDGMPGYLQGGLAHEIGHSLGLYDLYDTWGETIGSGGWALMGTGNWNMMGLVPPHISAWHAEKLEWIKQLTVNSQQLTDIPIYYMGGNDTSKVKMHKVHINSDEYFLITERFAYVSPDTHKTIIIGDSLHPDDSTYHYDSSGVRVWKDGVMTRFDDYDWGLPCDSMTGGLAIWHIDKNKIAKDSLWNEINVGSPKGIDMEEADGIQDFEEKVWLVSDLDAAFFGSKWDLFFSPWADSLTPTTVPNTNSNSGANSGISIYDISTSDTGMTFSLKFNLGTEGFPRKFGSFFDICSPNFIDDNGERIIFGTCMDTNEIVIGIDTCFVGGIVFACTYDSVLWVDTTRIDPARRFGTNLFSSVAVGDIDGNDTLDVVTTSFVVWGVPYGKGRKPIKYSKAPRDTFSDIEGNLDAWNIIGDTLFTKYHVTDGAIIGAPLLANIDDDAKDEILFTSEDGRLYCFKFDSLMFAVELNQYCWSTPVFDSTTQTIYVLGGDGRLFAINTDGTLKWESLEPHLPFTSSSPVVGDIDGDSKNEIIVSTGEGILYSISNSGDIEFQMGLEDTSFYTTPALADMDGDGYLDIILATGNKIYCINHNGAVLPGFPIDTKGEDLQSSPVIGDIDGDGELDIVIASPDRKLLAYNSRGKPLSLFPLSMGGSVYSTPALLDNKIVIGDGCGELWCFSLPYQYGEIPVPMFHKNRGNNGLFEAPPTPGLPTEDIFMTSDFYIYPNPVRKNGGKVKYFSGDADKVDIKIINLAGNIVKEFEGKIFEKTNGSVELPLSDVAAGVYLLRVKVEKSGKKMVRFKKFGVIK